MGSQAKLQTGSNTVWTKAPDSVAISHWVEPSMHSFLGMSALGSNKTTIIHAHPTLTGIHIRSKYLAQNKKE